MRGASSVLKMTSVEFSACGGGRIVSEVCSSRHGYMRPVPKGRGNHQRIDSLAIPPGALAARRWRSRWCSRQRGTVNRSLPSNRSPKRCMSENTINAALRRLGFSKDQMTGHGFRSAASSMLNESGLWSADAIERQLAHVDADSVRRAYARADYWEERVRMMTWWADRCDEMKRGGVVVPLRA